MSEIIVGMDESCGAADALRWAVRESNLHGWPVRAVHAWDTHNRYPDSHIFDADAHDAAEKALVSAVDHALGDDASEHIAVEVVRASAAHALLDRAPTAHMLVVGARGQGGFELLRLGSVGTHCLHHAPCPLAIVRHDRRRWTDGRIVVGIDGSDPSQRALHWALTEARLRACPVEVVHAWRIPVVGGFYAVAMEPALAEAAAQHVMDAALASEDTSGIPLETRIPCGGPAERLLHAADTADLVVVGSTGKGNIRRLLVGSVSHQLAHHAPCPVVSVP